MGGGSSKNNNASTKSEKLEDQIQNRKDDSSPSKKDVRQSLRESSQQSNHSRRSRSVAQHENTNDQNRRLRDRVQHMYDTNNIRQLQQDDDADDWNYDVAYGLRIDRPQGIERDVIPPELLQSEATVNGLAMAAVRNSRSDSDDGWGGLNETTGQRRISRNNNQTRSNNNRNAPMFDESAYLAENDQEGIYQDMMNEAIMQSLLESTQNQGQEMNQQDEEEKILKEVMKMSSLEYQKQTGKIDLSHLKKNKQKKNAEPEDLDDQQMMRLARMAAPKTLAPVQMKQGVGKFSPRNHIASTNTMKTSDNTTVAINPSQSHIGVVQLNQEYEEDTILKEASLLLQQQSQRGQENQYESENGLDISKSPGKFEKQLQKLINNEQQRSSISISKDQPLKKFPPSTVNINDHDITGLNHQEKLNHYMTIDENNAGQMTSKNSQGGNTTVMQSMRSPTEMGYDELSENILAGSQKAPINNKAVNYKFKSNINEPSDTQTFTAEFGENSDKQKGKQFKENSSQNNMLSNVSDSSPIKVVQNKTPRNNARESGEEFGFNLDQQIEADIKRQAKKEKKIDEINNVDDLLEDLDGLF